MLPLTLTYDTPLLHPAAPGIDLRGYEWFDRDSDGPYTLQEVETTLQQHREMSQLADLFHLTGRLDLRYSQLLADRLRVLWK